MDIFDILFLTFIVLMTLILLVILVPMIIYVWAISIKSIDSSIRMLKDIFSGKE